MSTIRLTKFTKTSFLKQIGRHWLGQLFARFSDELTSRGVTLPSDGFKDDEYFTALAQELAPDALPVNLVEALVAIEGLANADGQERLEQAAMRAGLMSEFPEGSTHGDIAVQVYLAKPELLVAQHNAARLGRLSAFEYFGGKQKAEIGKADMLSPEVLAALEAELDVWFKAHNRGHRTTRIEMHVIEGEYHFMVRHGDTFTRTAKVENEHLEIMHFRPAKDDVVVYAPKRNEIRVHAGTKGEKELYRRAFGQSLFGDAEHFSERKAYTLEPLREDCAAALDPRGLPGVAHIVLREVELAWGRDGDEFMVRGGIDLLASARSRGREVIPEYGKIVRAVFEFHFTGQKKVRRVEVRTPNTVKLGRGCDPRVIHEWLSARGFRVNVSEACGSGRTSLEKGMVVA
jgi:hypothetical protein